VHPLMRAMLYGRLRPDPTRLKATLSAHFDCSAAVSCSPIHRAIGCFIHTGANEFEAVDRPA
jgi:hypothetical protein